MSDDPDRVVVELIADPGKFDVTIKQSASSFGGAMKQIEQTATGAEKTVAASTGKMAAAHSTLINAIKAGSPVTAKMIQDAGGWAQAEKLLAGALTQTATAERNATTAATGLAAANNAAAASGTRSLGAMQQASRNLGFQIGDIGTQLSAGTSPFLILAQQGPQVANALDGAGGAVGRFAGFLSGPWGAAMLAAVSILGVFIGKNISGGQSLDDMVEKLKKTAAETLKTKDAQLIFSQTIEGVTQAINENREALDKLNLSQKSAAESALAQAGAAAIAALRVREKTVADLEAAQAAVAIDRTGATVSGADPTASFAQAQNEKNLANLTEALKVANDKLAVARKNVVEGTAKLYAEAANASPEDRINAKYNALIDAAARAAAASGATAAALRKEQIEVHRLNDERAKEIKLLNDRSKAPKSSGLSGNQVSASEAASIARAAGLQVNSSSRSFGEQKALYDHWVAQGKPADNPVAMPGTSAHEGAKGRWALDIQFGQGVTPQLLRKVFADQGVNLSKVIKERGHFHIEGSTSQADTSARDAQRLAEQEVSRRKAFQNELASEQSDELDARRSLIASAEEIDAIQLEAIEAVRRRKDIQISEAEEEFKASNGVRGLNAQQAEELRKVNDATAQLRAERVQRAADERNFRIREADAQRALQFHGDSTAVQEELLHSQEGAAKTAREKHDIDRRLIDLEYEEERIQNRGIITARDQLQAQIDRLKSERQLDRDEEIARIEAIKVQRGLNDEQAKRLDLLKNSPLTSPEEDRKLADENNRAGIAQGRLDTSDQRQANAQKGNDEHNASPLQKFFQDGTKDANELNEALEGVAARGLTSVTDGLTDAILGMKSFGDVGRAVLNQITAELIKMVIQMLIVKAIKLAIGMSDGGSVGGDGGGITVDTKGTIFHANGGPIGFADGGMPGGLISGPGTGTSDSIPAITTRGRPVMISDGEFIIRASSVKKAGLGNLEHINRTGTIPGGYAGGGEIGSVIRPSNAYAFAANQAPAAVPEPTARQIVHRPTFVFPGISNERQAREAAGQAARRYRMEMNGPRGLS